MIPTFNSQNIKGGVFCLFCIIWIVSWPIVKFSQSKLGKSGLDNFATKYTGLKPFCLSSFNLMFARSLNDAITQSWVQQNTGPGLTKYSTVAWKISFKICFLSLVFTLKAGPHSFSSQTNEGLTFKPGHLFPFWYKGLQFKILHLWNIKI